MNNTELFLRPQLLAHREEKSRNNGKHVLTSLVAMETGMQPISGVPRNFFGGGGSTNSVEDRENGDLGVVGP